MTDDAATCMYYGGPGPFTDEHVVPASIGGDDRTWMLRGCVCGGCNTAVFSPLELKFARSSPFLSVAAVPAADQQEEGKQDGATQGPDGGEPV